MHDLKNAMQEFTAEKHTILREIMKKKKKEREIMDIAKLRKFK